MLFQLQKRGGRGIGLNPWLELIREQGGRGLHPIAKKINNKVSMGFGSKVGMALGSGQYRER